MERSLTLFGFGTIIYLMAATVGVSEAQSPGAASLSDADLIKTTKLSAQSLSAIKLQYGIDNVSLAKLPAKKLQNMVRKATTPNWLIDRDEVRWRENADKSGKVKTSAFLPAAQKLKDKRNTLGAREIRAGIPTGKDVNLKLKPKVIDATDWKAIGPGNIGGRVRSFFFDGAANPKIVLASVGGGIWTSDDDGASWEPIPDLLPNIVVTTIVQNPKNSFVIYAGTGEGYGNSDASQGVGILKSTDRGISWSQLAQTANDNFPNVNRIAIAKNGKDILAANSKGIFRSEDYGENWAQVHTKPMGDVDFHPTDSDLAIAGSLKIKTTEDGKDVWFSKAYHSEDGGKTWKKAKKWKDGGRVEVTYAKADASTVYASVDLNQGEIWRSTDGGKTYAQRNTGKKFLGTQGWYGNALWAGDPTDKGLVVVGGIDLWRSTDDGQNLTRISDWTQAPASAHADHHFIVAHPGYNGTTNKKVYFANDGGLYKATNVKTVTTTTGWTSLNNGLPITQFHGIAGSKATGVVVGGTQDNGTIRYKPGDGAESWVTVSGGDGGFCAADTSNSNVFYGEYVRLWIHRSTNGGNDADYIHGVVWNGTTSQWDWKAAKYRIEDAKDENANFIPPFIVDPNNVNRILAGGLSLWRTNDAKAALTDTTGPTWKSIKDKIGDDRKKNSISAIAVAPGNPDVVWVGHNDGSLFRTKSGTAATPNWDSKRGWLKNPDQLRSVTFLPERRVQRIAIDPKDANRVFVTFGGYETDNVWRTTNDGTLWTNVSGDLPEVPARSVVIHPKESNYVYLGTEVGVFASDDGGDTWLPTNQGPTNSPVFDLSFVGQKLIAATHGRGAWQIDIVVEPEDGKTKKKPVKKKPKKGPKKGPKKVPPKGPK